MTTRGPPPESSCCGSRHRERLRSGGASSEDGRLPIDNTRVERALRPVAVGRKNYLLCGSDAGTRRAASAYTLLGTCVLVGVDPRAYLKDVLVKHEMQRLPASRIDELLPPNWT